MNDIVNTALKSLVSVAILFILGRLMGKKQISQLTFFDYIAGISIGSIAAEFAVSESVDYTRGITALIVYAAFPIVLSYLALKSYRGRKLLDGKPAVLIQNGRLVQSNLIKTKMNVDDLLEECRLKNVFDIAEIEYAILETSGKLSLQLKSQNQPLTPQDMNLPTGYKGLCTNLIIDGKILPEQLKTSARDENWLRAELSKHNVTGSEEVLLAYLDSAGALHVHKKSSNLPPPPEP